ncbi:MAG: hypothetical protein H0Z30_06495 [Candidatus Marinimicrobia bacterium]|nr:hypothetical protein [Candidatus Neomarinimicrobiota bacterium]
MNRKIFKVILTLTISVVLSNAQVFHTARSISLAGAYSTYDTGPDALLWNPANLGHSNIKIGFSFGIFPFVPFNSLRLFNNSINASWFNKYMASGLYLDENKKKEMLSFFSAEGLNFAGEMCGRIIGMRIGHFAFSTNLHFISSGNIPKVLLDIPFRGIKLEQDIELDDVDAFAQSYMSLDMGYGHLLESDIINSYFDSFSVGVTFRLLLGIETATTKDVNGTISVFKDGISMEGAASIKGGIGGFGCGIGAGISGKMKERLSFGLSVNNLFSFIRWTKSTKEYEFEYRNFLKPEDFFDDEIDSLFEAGIISDTLKDVSPFSTVLPVYIVAGFGYNYSKKLDIYASMIQFVNESWYSSLTPTFSVGAEVRYLPILPIRFGINFGGESGFRWGGGFSIGGRTYSFDFGFSQDSGFFNKARGFTISFGHEFRF